MAEQSGVQDSPYQAGAVATVEALGAGTTSAVTSTAVIEEFWRPGLSGQLPGPDGVAEAMFTLMRPVLAGDRRGMTMAAAGRLWGRRAVMGVRAVFLVVHVASGVLALVLGPVALLAAQRRRTGAEALRDAYHWTVLVVCATATVVSVLAWARLWWLVPIGALSYGLALAGYLGSRRHWPLWVRAHAWGGSYIALVTALLVVSVRGVSPVLEVVAWIGPAAIGVPLIVRAHTTGRPAGEPA